MKTKTKKKFLTIRFTLIMFAVLPLVLTSLLLCIISVSKSSKELKQTTRNGMLVAVEEIGAAFDYAVEKNEATLKSFADAPIVKEALMKPGDSALVAEAQRYVAELYADNKGWEGMYIGNWNSVILAHSSEGAVGMQLREGDKLTDFQKTLVSAGDVYNIGMVTSPASGQLIMSMYSVVYDDNKNPIGFVGGGTYVGEIAANFADVSGMGLSTGYVYFVDATGKMLYHPDASKIGNQVENEAVKGVVGKLSAGIKPAPECVEYLYKGAMKYAAYYVGNNGQYVAVYTADETEALSAIDEVKKISIIVGLVCVVLFTAMAVCIAKLVVDPMKAIAGAMGEISNGNVTADLDAKSHIEELIAMITSYGGLKQALYDSMTKIKESASVLGVAVVNVDEKTAGNVESIEQINQAINEVATTSQTVAEEAQQMASKAVDLGEEINILGDNVTKLHDGALVIKKANDEATKCMKSVLTGSQQSVEAVTEITTKINDTNEAIEKIGNALVTIESIASQTNLLSLNASIEAARAGEAGRGFAIVAEEIRTLADSSALSAQEIRHIVEEIINLSNATVSISGKVSDVINSQQADIEEAQDKFSKLSETVEDSVSQINVIKDIAESMGGIKDEFSRITTDMGAISEELGAAAEEVAASCQTVAEGCTDTQASTEEMRAINETMNSAIGFFKL